MAKDRDGDRDIVAEIINMVAAQVSSGMRVAGEVRERQEQARQQLEGGLRALRDAADVSVRMIRLLDEIEEPLRESIPVIRRAAGVLDEVLDALPDDLASQLSEALPRVRSLLDALAPLAAMGAAMSPRPATAPTTPPVKRPAAPAKKAPRTTASTPKKTAPKKAAPKKAAPKK
ncbi:MAG: hypothetical protein ACPHGX_07610, partial [Ilumatobacteraceae bacterium]